MSVGRLEAAGARPVTKSLMRCARRPARMPDKVRGGGSEIIPMGEAKKAEIIVLAVPWGAVPDAVKSLGALAGKTLVDATNPLTPGFELALGYTDSAAESVARLAPGAHVVKAFNTTGAENMAGAHEFKVKPMMPVASDDAGAKAKVMQLASDLGFEPIDAGPLTAARLLESLAVFWIKQAYVQKFGRDFASPSGAAVGVVSRASSPHAACRARRRAGSPRSGRRRRVRAGVKPKIAPSRLPEFRLTSSFISRHRPALFAQLGSGSKSRPARAALRFRVPLDGEAVVAQWQSAGPGPEVAGSIPVECTKRG